MRRLITLTFTLFFIIPSLFSQFQLNGVPILVGDRCYQLTNGQYDQYSSIWSSDKINLSKSFEIVADINFGADDKGADGVTFALGENKYHLQNWNGSEFSVAGLNPSVIVEFDTYDSAGFSDPFFDHIAIMKNGGLKHVAASTLSNPVPMTPTFSNVEDGKYHTVVINWNANLKELKVYFDCNLRQTLKLDIKKDIFNNDDVYWGFTSASGWQANKQTVCIKRASMLDDFKEVNACIGDTISVKNSIGNITNWSPTVGLSNPKIYNPITIVKYSQTYISKSQHSCNLTYSDTFKLNVPKLIPAFFPNDTSFCDKNSLTLNISASDAKSYQWNFGSVDSIVTISKSGFYKFSSSDGNCIYSDSINVIVNPTPKVNLGKDTIICENQSLLLNAANINANYLWSDGSNFAQLFANNPGEYWVKVTSDKNCTASDSILIGTKPIFNTVQTVEICEGSFYTFAGKNWTKDTTVCETYNAINACDSTHCVTIKVKPKQYFTIDKDICKGDYFELNKIKYFQKGNYQDILTAQNGCDSIVKINIGIITVDTILLDKIICEGEVQKIGNQNFDKTGTYSITLKDTQTNCDSLVYLNLKVIPKKGFSDTKEICDGEEFLFGTKKLNKAGFYEETLKNSNGCDSIISLNLKLNPTPKVNILAAKNAFCSGDSLTLTADFNAQNEIIWNNLEKNNTIIVSKSGIYKVVVRSDKNCQSSDSIEVFESPLIALNPEVKAPSCTGYNDGSVTLNATGGFGFLSYQMNENTFQKENVYSNLPEGKYIFTVKDTVGCKTTQNIALINPTPKFIEITGNQKVVKLGDSTLVEVFLSFKDVKSLTWLPNENIRNENEVETWLKPINNTKYIVMVTDSAGCVLTDTIQVIVNPAIDIFIPDVFSANFDGINDDLRVFAGMGIEKILQYSVFDRWGNQVFDAQNYFPSESIGWDGTYRGKTLEQGAYTYFVKFLKKNKEVETRSGNFMMLR